MSIKKFTIYGKQYVKKERNIIDKKLIYENPYFNDFYEKNYYMTFNFLFA